jgi:hypothetical protein
MSAAHISLKSDEVAQVRSWLDTSAEGAIPKCIRKIILDLCLLPEYLSQNANDKASLLRMLRTLMGINPSSEKGSPDLK